ncbi:MAG: hypothetical protein AVDCRST_MAG41-3888, partial [uncultured Corynebacteriales bacterium]
GDPAGAVAARRAGHVPARRGRRRAGLRLRDDPPARRRGAGGRRRLDLPGARPAAPRGSGGGLRAARRRRAQPHLLPHHRDRPGRAGRLDGGLAGLHRRRRAHPGRHRRPAGRGRRPGRGRPTGR